jgi:hypothetical protein
MNTESDFCVVRTEFLKSGLDEPQVSQGRPYLTTTVVSYQQTDPPTSLGCFHTGRSVHELLVSRPHTRKWLGRTRVAVTSQAESEALK